MPRRNRNVRAFRIDADALADQADRLSAEFAITNSGTALVIDETQLYYQLGAFPRTGKSSIFRDYLARFIHEHPGCQISLTDPKAVTSYVS